MIYFYNCMFKFISLKFNYCNIKYAIEKYMVTQKIYIYIHTYLSALTIFQVFVPNTNDTLNKVNVHY